MTSHLFESPFLFGVATAAYQVEGAHAEAGRGPSIWDTFSHTPGKTLGGDTGDVACNHYHLWRSDLEIMAALGVDAYRMSISWSRVQPSGTGPLNRAGVDFYRRLLTRLNELGIRPVVTLYHWDLPQPLQDAGGWAVRSTALAFAQYARAIAQELGDLVADWTTLNEPWCTAFLGYCSGQHAPGVTNPATSLRVTHHLNLAHGLAVREIRDVLGTQARCSAVLNLHVVRPADPQSPDDAAAVARIEAVGNEIFLGPMLEGRLPDSVVNATAGLTDWSFVAPEDLTTICQPIDWLGVNYYSSNLVRRRRPGDRPSSGGHGDTGASPWPGCGDIAFLDPQGPLTAMGWNIDPGGLKELLQQLANRFPGVPLVVTENGAAFADVPDASGKVTDEDRIAYLRSHIAAVGEARDAGADVRGYFLWSLLDNFEWAWGYSRRFGIVRVDFQTQQRIPKSSFHWYRRLIASRCLETS